VNSSAKQLILIKRGGKLIYTTVYITAVTG
jgi:hypothetical protein